MKKVLRKISKALKEFWLLRVMNYTQKKLTVGGFEFHFRQYDLTIRSLSGNFTLKVLATEPAFGYLVQALAKDRKDNLHGYAAFMYLISSSLVEDDNFRSDIQSALTAYNARMMASASYKANNEDEDIAIATMKKELDRGQMSRAARRRAEKAFAKDIKNIKKQENNE